MNLCRCERGHFYDKEKFATCPHCGGGGASDEKLTEAFTEDVTVPMNGASAPQMTPPPVAPAFGGAAPQAQPVNKVSTPCVGWLIALGGEHIGTDFRLKTGKNFIGRSPQMDIALTDDKSVSRERHAIVVYDPKSNMYLVQPGESSSLAYHNNNLLLTPEKLEAYDMVTVGDVNLLFMPLCSEKFSWGNVLEEMKKKQQ